jgi:hypothetical protein
MAQAVPGASSAEFNEYYPSFSADSELMSFTRVATGQTFYNNAQAESFVVPVGGGTPVRLAANDAPACVNTPSPGITNSWIKWSPEVTQADRRKFYWLTFSSTRENGLPRGTSMT